MIQKESMNDAEVHRFLLGEMSEDVRIAFEESFVADDGIFEQIRVVEDELIESYLRGRLSPLEKEKFERSFLLTKRRRQRVEFVRLMLDRLDRQKDVAVSKKSESAVATSSVWDSLVGLFKTPQLAFGAALALLVLLLGAWYLLKTSTTSEIVRQQPTPLIQNTPPHQNQTNPKQSGDDPDNKNTSPNSNREASNKNQNSNTQQEESTPILALFAGTVRAEGKLSTLHLAKDAANANLQLHLESEDYQIYRVELVDANGNLVFQRNNLKARNSIISLLVPAAKLAAGDYLVKLSALNPRHENESVADYPFRVNRQ